MSELSREVIERIKRGGGATLPEHYSLCDMALAHLDSKEAGRVSVPKEPTDEMVAAYLKAQREDCDGQDRFIGALPQGGVQQAFKAGYRAMLSAAPAPAAKPYTECTMPPDAIVDVRCCLSGCQLKAAPAATTGTGWISPKDRLPEDQQEVRFQVASGAVFNGWYSSEYEDHGAGIKMRKHFTRGDFGCKVMFGGTYTHGVVRCWMPLPAAPSPDAPVCGDASQPTREE